MADWMKAQGFDSPRLRWFVEYGCRDDFGATLRQTSAWAGIHYFASRLEEGRDEPAEFLTWPEGNGRLVAQLAKTAGARLRLNALVADVDPRTDGVRILYYDDSRRESVALRASTRSSRCRASSPRTSSRRGARPPRRGCPEAVYGSWMVANLTLRERPRGRGFPLAWDNVLYDSESLGYVVATHQSGRDHGATVLTYYLPLVDDDARGARARLLATRFSDWCERILADLGRAHPGCASWSSASTCTCGATRWCGRGPATCGARRSPRARVRSAGCTSRTPISRAWRSSRRRSTGASARPRP
jgi:hypothetical protein